MMRILANEYILYHFLCFHFVLYVSLFICIFEHFIANTHLGQMHISILIFMRWTRSGCALNVKAQTIKQNGKHQRKEMNQKCGRLKTCRWARNSLRVSGANSSRMQANYCKLITRHATKSLNGSPSAWKHLRC